MAEVVSLWLPMLVASVVVFVGSAIAWMFLPHHKKEWGGLPDEDAFLALMRKDVPPGQYMFPYCPTPSALKDPEVKKRYEGGPHGALTIWPGEPNMGKKMGATFVFYVVLNVFVAYLATIALAPGAGFLPVFRFVGAVAIVGYVFGFIPHAIWFGRTPHSIVTDIADGVVYGLLTGLVYALLWPGGA